MTEPTTSAVPVNTSISPDVQSAVAEALGQLIEKSQSLVKSEHHVKEPKAWFNDPFQLLDSLGMGYRSSPSYLTYDTLRAVSERDTVVAAIIATRVNQVASFARPQENKYSVGFKIRPRGSDKKRRLSSSEKERVREIEHFILNTGANYNVGRDSFEQFLRKTVRDRLTYDQLTFEKVRDYANRLHTFYAVPADTIRIAHPVVQKGTPPAVSDLKRHLKYVQLLNAQIVTEYTQDELAFAVANPRTHVKVYGYGLPEIETLMTTITSHMWAEEWNRRAFSQGSTVKGVLNIRGQMPQNQFEAFKRQWTAQVSGVTNAWRTPVTNTDGLDWIAMQMSNTEMGYQMWMEYLIKITCFPPEQRVRMADGLLRRIDRVRPGDRVLTHMGRVREVKNVQVHNHDGVLVGLRAGGRTIRATTEHPFYVSHSTTEQRGGERTRTFSEPEWCRADAIVEGNDYLAVPKIREHYAVLGETQIDLADHVEAEVTSDSVCLHGHRAVPIPRFIPLTEANAYVLGLYAAEGCVTDYTTIFTLSSDERSYANLIHNFAKRVGVTSRETPVKSTVISVRLGGGVLARALRHLFGHGAKNKRVPREIREAPLAVQRAFLSGLFAGDGSVYRNSNGTVSFAFGTASRKLADQVHTMLLAQDIYACQYCWSNRGGFATKRSKLYDLRVDAIQLRKLSSWLVGEQGDKLRKMAEAAGSSLGTHQKIHETESYFYVPVSETWREPYEGLVYNIEVVDDHSYVIDHYAVHNCAIFQIDPTEINFDLRGGTGQAPVFMSTNEAQQKVSKDRGLQPLLRFIEDMLNRHIVWDIDDRFELAFLGLDAKTEEQALQLRMQQVQNTHTLNEVRALEDLPPVKEGDIVLNPTYTGYLTQKDAAAQQQAMMAQQGGAPGQGPPPGQGTQPDQGAPGDPNAAEQPYQGRFSQAPPGEEEQAGADRLRQMTEKMQQAQPQKSEGGDDDQSSPADERQLHVDDWASSVHSSLPAPELAKSYVYATIDLE